MVFKFMQSGDTGGGHVNVRVFVGADVDHLALTGTLTMRVEEATALRNLTLSGQKWLARKEWVTRKRFVFWE